MSQIKAGIVFDKATQQYLIIDGGEVVCAVAKEALDRDPRLGSHVARLIIRARTKGADDE